MKTNEYVSEYYRNYDEEGRLLSRHGRVEYVTTMTYIGKYLRPGMRIMEIGAATGRYSHALAQKGYSVDALELVEHNIEIFKRNTLDGEPVTITQGNAVDLSSYESNWMDDATYSLFLKYHLATCERQDMVGLSHHTLDIFRKEEN